MRLRVRVLLAAALVVAVAVVAAGCGGGGDTKGAAGDAGPAKNQVLRMAWAPSLPRSIRA